MQAGRPEKTADSLTKIAVDGLFCNLSGAETQFSRLLAGGAEQDALLRSLFQRICACLTDITEAAASKYAADSVLFTGGVSASRCIRKQLGALRGTRAVFAGAALSSDNAVGTALLGVDRLWE
jgi:tRNA A37 threonylcarbamoyltransferase TsaD